MLFPRNRQLMHKIKVWLNSLKIVNFSPSLRHMITSRVTSFQISNKNVLRTSLAANESARQCQTILWHLAFYGPLLCAQSQEHVNKTNGSQDGALVRNMSVLHGVVVKYLRFSSVLFHEENMSWIIELLPGY